MHREIYFDLEEDDFAIPEVNVSELVEIRIREYMERQGLIHKPSFIKDFNSLGYYSPQTNLWNVFSEKDAYFGVFSNDVSGFFLGTGKQILSIQEFIAQESWDNINIAEVAMISDWSKVQSSKYLYHFGGNYGLKPYGQIRWNSYNGKIAFAEVCNADGTRFINGKLQE